jgi:replicative DNA helicase
LRFGVSSRAYCIPKAGYRDSWNLHVFGVDNQRRFLRDIDVHGVKFLAVREVLIKVAGVKSNDNVDTIPRAVWDAVRQGVSDQRMTHRAFAEAMQTKFCGSTIWKHSPSRGRLHRAAAVLDDQALHDLTTNDVFCDKVLEITSVGEQDVYRVAVADTANVVVQGVSIKVPRLAGEPDVKLR